jgi:hypothetical protein
MIGKHPPVARRYFHGPMPDVPDVDPVEPEPGCARRKRARRAAQRGRMDFFQARKHQPPVRAFAPVVEVAGDDERRAVGNFVGDQIQKPINLSAAVRLAQREMHTDRVQWLTITIQPDHCVEQTPRLGPANRCIDIAPSGDRMPGEQRIAVMPARRNSVPAVGVLSPDAIRKYLVLMHVRLRTRNRTDFLKEDEVRPRGAQGIANSKQDAMPVSGTQSLMGIQRQHADPRLVAARCWFHAGKLYPEA